MSPLHPLRSPRTPRHVGRALLAALGLALAPSSSTAEAALVRVGHSAAPSPSVHAPALPERDDDKRKAAARKRSTSAKPPARSTAKAPAKAGAKAAAKPSASEDPQSSSRRRSRRTAPSRRRPAPSKVAVVPALAHTAPRSANALATDLGFMLDARVRSGTWGAVVVSLTRGDTLYSRNADVRMQPASTMKLMTAAIALERFGPDYQFSTDVLRDGTVGADGTLTGDIVIRGDGDPSFSNRWLRGDANAPMVELARQVAAAGIRRVSGNVVGDATGFDDQRVPDGWQSRYLQAGYAARVSALSINENLLWVAAYPGSGKGPARVVLEPATTLIPLVANVRTVAGSSGGAVRVSRRGDGTVVASGWIGSRSIPRKYSYVMDDPAAYTAGAFRAALQAQGITVDGAVRMGPTPGGAVRVASFQSQPVARLVSVMNRESINHYAELLFRNAARGPSRERQGTSAHGASLLEDFLTTKVKVAPRTVRAADGSGLSVLDSVTPRSMVQLLAHAHGAPWGPAFHASLPVAGESELLRNRMRLTPAQGNLHAKTGTTNTVISLAGYVTARDGEVLAFAFIYNGADRWNARSTIDVMGATMAGFVRN